MQRNRDAKNRMREIRSYGSVGVSAGNRRHYPATTKGFVPLVPFCEENLVCFRVLRVFFGYNFPA